MSFMHIGQWQAHDAAGHRKYVTGEERLRFLAAADRLPASRRALCYLLVFTGCRISEALSLAPYQVNADNCTVTFRTLKRRRLCFRTVPVPAAIIRMLAAIAPASAERFWTMHRTTAWRMVTAAMRRAAVEGPMSTCKGLRHGFGVRAAGRDIPPSLIAKWLGHASLATTAIYLDVVGQEERAFASRLWKDAPTRRAAGAPPCRSS